MARVNLTGRKLIVVRDERMGAVVKRFLAAAPDAREAAKNWAREMNDKGGDGRYVVAEMEA